MIGPEAPGGASGPRFTLIPGLPDRFQSSIRQDH